MFIVQLLEVYLQRYKFLTFIPGGILSHSQRKHHLLYRNIQAYVITACKIAAEIYFSDMTFS